MRVFAAGIDQLLKGGASGMANIVAWSFIAFMFFLGLLVTLFK